MSFAPGTLVKARGREWVVLPESEDDFLVVRPLGGTKPLRVSTAPTVVFEVGSRVWLEIAPSAMVRVE